MNGKTLGALIAVNAVLLLAINALVITQPQTAHAQFSDDGDFTMIAAKRGGNSAHTVNIFDTTSGIMITVEPSRRSQGEIEVIAFRDISKDFSPRTGR